MSFSTDYASPQGNTRLLESVQRNSKYQIISNLVKTISKFEETLRAAICTECIGENKSGTKMAGRRGRARLCRGVLVLEDEQRLIKRLRPRRAFQTWRTMLPEHRGLLCTAFLSEVVRFMQGYSKLGRIQDY